MASNDDLLAEQRKLIFEALQRQGGFYDSPNSQGVMDAIMRQVKGEDQPFTGQVVTNMLADNADASAGGFRNNRDMIARAMANAGLTGSGLEQSALMSAQMQQGRMARQGRREINTRAQLENFQARERAQTAAMNFLAQQEQAKRAVAFAEVDQRGKMHATGDATNVAAATGQPMPQGQQPGVAAPQTVQPALSKPTPARPTQYGLSNATLSIPRWGGISGGLPSTGYVSPQQVYDTRANYDRDTQMYQAQIQQQTRDRAYLSQLQADWDSRYGG